MAAWTRTKIGRDNFGHVTRINDPEGGLKLVMKKTDDGLGGKGTVKKKDGWMWSRAK